MKNIGSNAVDFLNKLKIGKMMKIVYKNKWVLLSLVLLVLFYHFYYSMKSFKEGIEDIVASTDTVEEEENNITPATDSTTRKSKGAYDRSVNSKIKTSEQNIRDKQKDTVALKDDINVAINGIKTNIQSIINRDKAIAKKIPKEE